MQDLNNVPKPPTSLPWHKQLHSWFVMDTKLTNKKPWQALFIITKKLRGIVAILIALAIIGTGITIFIFVFPWRLSHWLPVLQVFLGLFFISLLLFIYFRTLGNHFHAKFLEEVRLLINDQQHTFIPLDKRKILRQFEWYSKDAILKVNFIALCLALTFSIAPKKIMSALNPHKVSLEQSMQAAILKKHRRIAQLKTMNEQSKRMIGHSERLIRHHQTSIKHLRAGMQRHYRQIIELRRYLRHLNKVGYQIGQLKKIGHSEVWKQERVIKSSALVMAHAKGLTQAKLEQKEKPVKLADVMLSKRGAILEKFKQLRVRYHKLERRTNHFSYLNSLEIKRAEIQITKNKALIDKLEYNIKQRRAMVKKLKNQITTHQQKLPYLDSLDQQMK